MAWTPAPTPHSLTLENLHSFHHFKKPAFTKVAHNVLVAKSKGRHVGQGSGTNIIFYLVYCNVILQMTKNFNKR